MRAWLLGAGLVATAVVAAALALLLLLVYGARSVPPVAEPGRHGVRVVDTRRIVPGPGLPAEVGFGASNNNLDVVRHDDGFVYLALRTAPHHFASEHAAIAILRSRDETDWELEARFHLGHDLREPRLLSHDGALFLYVSRLGRDAWAFEPQGIAVSERAPDGTWSALRPLGPPGAMGWRVRKLGGTPVMMVYTGADELYTLEEATLRVEMWRSDDGLDWRPWDPEHPVVYEGGGSEADFAEADDGALYGVIRNEAGDATGWGSKVCRAAPGAPARWHCHTDARKFDSPFLFWHDGEAYLLARRNLRGDGRYDLGVGPGRLLRTAWNQVAYSLTSKRCALWRYVQDEDRIAFVLDLPSRGDTCFPAVIAGPRPDELVVYDYSSDLEGPDLRWLQGQLGETFVYRHVLRFERLPERADALRADR